MRVSKLPFRQDNHPFGGSLACLVYYGDLIHDLGPGKPRRV